MSTTWALHVHLDGSSVLLVIEVSDDATAPPALHLAALVSRSPARVLTGTGWAPVSGWLPRSWGALAEVIARRRE